MELVRLSFRTKMLMLLGAGYPILTFLSVLVLSYCIDRSKGALCSKLISNIQSIWSLWIICTILVLLLIVLGKKEDDGEKEDD